MTPRHLTRHLALALLIPGAACFHLRHSSPAAAAPAAAMTKAPAPAPAKTPTVTTASSKNSAKNTKKVVLPTEANVGATLLAAGNSDRSYAQIASVRAQSQVVKDYVARITRDNVTVNQLVNDVMTKMQMSPVENAASLEYRDESAMNRDMLRDLQGRAFDSTYMMNEVAHHTRLLASIDNVLTPAAKTPQLKQLLVSLRPVVAAELDHAEQVRRTLAATK
jgi:predicted outer membrane protein